MDSSSESSDDEYYWNHIRIQPALPRRGGSVAGKSQNIERGRHEAGERFFKDYFGDSPTYSDEHFRRRFRMRRSLFEHIVEEIIPFDDYFRQKPDATGRLGFLPEQKATAALRILAYGSSADQLDEVIRMGESTSLQCLQRFCEAVVAIFGGEFLRTPTADDLKQILAENEKRKWPGMLGCIDCMHWPWKNCPVAWQGAFQGKEGCPTLILEAVCDQKLRIWHAFFGMPGSNNDLNVLDR